MTRKNLDRETLRYLIEDSGLPYTQNSISWIFTCPRCDKAKKLYISKKSGRFVCFRCKETDNFQGRPEYALAELLGESVGEVSKKLYGDEVVEVDLYLDIRLVDFFGDGDELDEEVIEHEVEKWPWDFYSMEHQHAARGLEYIQSRGISKRHALQYDMRYCPAQRRVYFPIGEHGLLYGWQGRLIIPNKYVNEEGEEFETPKILSSKGLRRERLLMFSDRLRGAEHAVVCEGPVDAIKAHYCKGNVATMGKAVSREQVELLRNSGVKRIYLALDPDAAEEMNRLVSDLYGDVELYEMVPEGKPDLGAMSYEEVYQLFLAAPRIGPGRIFVFLDPKL